MKQLKNYLCYFLSIAGLVILFGIIFMPFCYYVSKIDNTTLVQNTFIPVIGPIKQYEYNLRVFYVVGLVIYLGTCFFSRRMMTSRFIVQTLVIISSITIVSYVFFDKSFSQINVLPSMLTFYIVTVCLLVVLLISNITYYLYELKNR